jgi:hypothetical protein
VRRRATVSGKPAKTQHRKSTRPKRSDVAIAARGANLSVRDLQEQLKRQTTELEEARDERAALTEVLRVISSSPGELELVFKTILESSTRICEARFGQLFKYGDGEFRLLATHNTPVAYQEFLNRGPIKASPEIPMGQMVQAPRTIHVVDVRNLEAHANRNPLFVAGVELAGLKSRSAIAHTWYESLRRAASMS